MNGALLRSQVVSVSALAESEPNPWCYQDTVFVLFHLSASQVCQFTVGMISPKSSFGGKIQRGRDDVVSFTIQEISESFSAVNLKHHGHCSRVCVVVSVL